MMLPPHLGQFHIRETMFRRSDLSVTGGDTLRPRPVAEVCTLRSGTPLAEEHMDY